MATAFDNRTFLFKFWSSREL